MPYKFNEARRGKFTKAKFRVTNWAGYNESLRRRGDLTVWICEGVVQNWSAEWRKTRGGQARYSDLSIELCLTLRVVFKLALRQTQGFMRLIARLLKLEFSVPNFSTLSRRGGVLKIKERARKCMGSITLIVDSTGLKVHGGNGWNAEKHGAKNPRKAWRKLHLGLNPDTGEIVTSELTTEHIVDLTAPPNLVDPVGTEVQRFIVDGAYDAGWVSQDLKARFGPDIEVIVLPPSNAVAGDDDERNCHISSIAKHGRMNWQRETGYNQRSLVEAQIGRWKTVIVGN